MTLNTLTKQQKAKILQLPQDPKLTIKLLEQGIVPELTLTLAHKAPFNGPLAFQFDGVTVSLPRAVAQQILVELV